MDPKYSEEAEAYREKMVAFLGEHLPADWKGMGALSPEQLATFTAEWRSILSANSLLAPSWPAEYGGGGLTALEKVIMAEEFLKAGVPTGGNNDAFSIQMVGNTILNWGSDEMKADFLPKIISGEYVFCQGYSEPNAGSDLAALMCKAELDGDEWVINGQKIWTSGASTADFMFILVRTEPDAKKHAGISYLLVDMKQPGIDVRPLKQMTGSAEFNEVFLSDVKTPKDWIVGNRGEGWLVSRTTLKHERNSIGAASQTLRLLDSLVDLARERKIDGKPAIEDPTIRRGLVELEGFVRSHQYSGFIQMSKGLKGENPGVIGLMNKISSTNMGHMVSKLAMEILGDEGLAAPAQVGLGMAGGQATTAAWISQYMSSLGVAIAGGTANIQRNVIAERGFALPRDAAANKSK